MSPQAARTSLSREQLQKVLLGVIIAIALVAGFWQLVLKPTALKRKKVERDIMVQQKEHQKNKNLVEAAAKIEASYTAARERLRQIMADSVPPQTNATAWANDRLNEHTRAKGIPLDLQAINEAGVDRPMTVRGGPVPLFEDYLINAELTGGYHSLGRFLARSRVPTRSCGSGRSTSAAIPRSRRAWRSVSVSPSLG